ncbi:probable aspartic proteinase GIP2 [Gastrolobium bilobum]|uniref:probable aspartic proteinase GIP2 n=1 Tax=Gastrolobium bilobum TaxID=150636 RepID=UPI002AB0300B|nr:probable aspartic proteinase GIP2 [Gastrolobium bilobum]
MASSATHFSLISIALLLFFCISQSHGKTELRPFILPIEKDTETNLFYTSVGIGTPRHDMNLVIDLGELFLWYDCNNHYDSSTYHPLPCDSKSCPKFAPCHSCNLHPKPGCTNDTCGVFFINPYGDSLFEGDFGKDVLFISHTTVSGLLSACINLDAFRSRSPLAGLPKSTKGILGLSRSQLALPTQLSSSLKLPRKFALCLPSSNKKGLGKLFLGGAPHSILHQNASKFLLTTPLVVNPVSTAPFSLAQGDPSYEYFIVVKSIKVGGEVLNFNSSLLSIDNKGNGGTKISTIDASTFLHSSIYKPLVRDFVKKAADRKIKKVASVAPFEACFDFNTIGRTVTGLDVPTIDLVLEGGVQWTIYGGNSMVLVKKNVACLGFVDGGKDPRTSFIIGGHMLEDNLLEFDLVSSKLGFSSSLLLHNARCSSLEANFFPF